MMSRRFHKLIVCLLALSTVAAYGSASASVTLPAPLLDEPLAPSRGQRTVVLAGGCFWGIEAVFERLKGVKNAVSGYSGGTKSTAKYDVVSSGRTDHAEAVQITYDVSLITYGTLLHVFFSVAHDPTQLNRQGPDIGPQYRSAIFFSDEKQREVAQAYIDQLNQAKVFPRDIVTKLVALEGFYRAEDYHQDYLVRNPDQPYIMMHDLPKLESLRRHFPKLYR